MAKLESSSYNSFSQPFPWQNISCYSESTNEGNELEASLSIHFSWYQKAQGWNDRDLALPAQCLATLSTMLSFSILHGNQLVPPQIITNHEIYLKQRQ